MNPPNMHLVQGLMKPPADLDWSPLRPGVDAAWIYREEGGSAAAYLRYQPGAEVPLHRHPAPEHIFVLEGAQEDEYGHYPAGSVVINPPGTRHTVRSPEGCLVLVVWGRQVEFL